MGPKDRSRGKATRKLQVIEGVQKRRRSLRSMTDWVRGYKLTERNGMSFFGSVQYELGKVYHCPGELIFCQNGLHFSKEALHTRAIMNYSSMRRVELWEVRAKPNRLRTNFAADGLAEKSITDELFMERKLSDAECREKLTGWVHSSRLIEFGLGNGSYIPSYDSWVYYYNGTEFGFTACQTVGSKRVLRFGLMREWLCAPVSARREIDDSPETLQNAMAEMRREAERYLGRILLESKEVSKHFRYADEHIKWIHGDPGVVTYRTPFDETDKNFVDPRDGGFDTHVASLAEATALMDRYLTTGSYSDPATDR